MLSYKGMLYVLHLSGNVTGNKRLNQEAHIWHTIMHADMLSTRTNFQANRQRPRS